MALLRDWLIFLVRTRALLTVPILLLGQLGFQLPGPPFSPSTARISLPVPNIPLQLVPPSPKPPDYDKQVLYPLYVAQSQEAYKEAARVEAARLASLKVIHTPASPLPAPAPLKPMAVIAPVIKTPMVQAPTGTCSSWMNAAGIVDQGSAYKLIMMESGCNQFSVNKSSGACGIPQALPCSKLGGAYPNGPVAQLVWMQNYVFSRYSTWANALQFHYAHNWY